jgi:hypothetical protein
VAFEQNTATKDFMTVVGNHLDSASRIIDITRSMDSSKCFSSSCCQRRTTFHPISRSVRWLLTSRWRFFDIFIFQKSDTVCSHDKNLYPCQKSPSCGAASQSAFPDCYPWPQVRYWIKFVDTALVASLRGSLCGSLGDCLFCFRVAYSMHDLECAAEQIAIVLERINDVCRHRKFRSAADQA